MSKVKRKEMAESLNDHERRIHRFERLLKKNGFGFDLPELPKTGDFFEIVQHHSQKLPKGKVLEVAKVNHNTNLIKFVGGFNGYFTDFDRSVYLGGAEDEPMKPCAKPEQAEPKLKQLDQSVFDGLDPKWRFAAVDKTGKCWVYAEKPESNTAYWFVKSPVGMPTEGEYDTTNWQNSLIERDKVELTGSDLCRAMLARGDKYVMCSVSMADDETALSSETATLNRIVVSLDKEWLYTETGTRWHYAVPINNQGEPLTATDAGL